MSECLRVGMIGAGMVSQYHLQGWLDCPQARLVAIADPDISKARNRALEVSGVKAYASFGEMLDSGGLDAVDIVTPPETHAELIATAQAAGLHVICQKPLATNAAEARSIETAIRPETRVMIHENWRWRPQYRALKKALECGAVSSPSGFIFRVESSGLLKNETGQYPALLRQPFFASMPRLLVFELLVHHLDTLSFLFGDVQLHNAVLDHRCPAVTGEDRAVIDLSAGGIQGKLVADFRVEGAPPLPNDCLQFDGVETPVVNGWQLNIPNQNQQNWDGQAAYQDSYSATIKHFASSLANGKGFETPVSKMVKLLELVDEIYASASTRT
jgi:predicted dehydrogenase